VVCHLETGYPDIKKEFDALIEEEKLYGECYKELVNKICMCINNLIDKNFDGTLILIDDSIPANPGSVFL